MLALPAQSRRLRQRFFHHCGGVDEYLDLGARCGDQPSRQRLQPLLDQVVIIIALRVDRNRTAGALLEYRQRILIRPVIDAEHDHRAHVGPQHPRVSAAFRTCGEPVHVAMRAGLKEAAKIFCGIRNRRRIGDADAIETERERLVGELLFQSGGRKLDCLVQKSRST